jgi:hypothetical protein
MSTRIGETAINDFPLVTTAGFVTIHHGPAIIFFTSMLTMVRAIVSILLVNCEHFKPRFMRCPEVKVISNAPSCLRAFISFSLIMIAYPIQICILLAYAYPILASCHSYVNLYPYFTDLKSRAMLSIYSTTLAYFDILLGVCTQLKCHTSRTQTHKYEK